MKINNSPWLHQLHKDRVSLTLQKDVETEIAIIGAGIAGIATAFFALKYTNKKIVMLERYKLAHGATGHNAGQVVSYFERGFASLVDEFGIERAAQGQKSIEDAWLLIEEMYTDAGLNIPFSHFLGHAGLSSYDQVILHLKNNYWRKKAGLNTEEFVISEKADFLADIPAEYADLYSVVAQEEISSRLETKNKNFIAVLSYQKGCVNSALFCEEVLLYIQQKYPDRFALFELTPVQKIILKGGSVLIDAEKYTITAERVILCTNGFTGITIINENGLDIHTKFHHLVHGTIGYMSGYLEKMNRQPTAISYLTDPDSSSEDPYFYLTRRFFEYEGDKDYNLISIGGPELDLDDHSRYSHQHEYSEEVTHKIDNFIRSIYEVDPHKKIDYAFTWHGLMGYTKNRVRLIGPEPKNSSLLYNLGCNGIGILPSIYGGKRISQILSGEKLTESIFDVPREYTEGVQ